MSKKIYAIKCTNCAAPLDILGGGRVNTLTCAYCHAMLDLNDHYKVLVKFNEIKRPDAPFEIGMQGTIQGLKWTIIGWISYKTIEFPSETWHEFFLYSPTHGYAWLINEKNQISFSKRIRNFDLYAWQTNYAKTIFYNKGHYIQKESKYDIYIDYVEGGLSWEAKFGDQITCRDYHGVTKKIINIEQSKKETEVYLTQGLNPITVYNAFNIPKEKRIIKRNIIERFESQQDSKKNTLENFETSDEESNTSIFRVFITLFILLLVFAVSSKFYTKPIYETSFTSDIKHNITIDSSGFLSSLYFSATGSGLSANLKIWLYKADKKIFYIDSDHVYFSKKDLGESWRYGSSAIVYLKLDEGTYRLIAKKDNPGITIHLKVEENVIRMTYIIPLLIILFILILSQYSHLLISNKIVIPILLFATFLGYNILGNFAIFIGLFFIFAYLQESYSNYSNHYPKYDDNDFFDDWDD